MDKPKVCQSIPADAKMSQGCFHLSVYLPTHTPTYSPTYLLLAYAYHLYYNTNKPISPVQPRVSSVMGVESRENRVPFCCSLIHELKSVCVMITVWLTLIILTFSIFQSALISQSLFDILSFSANFSKTHVHHVWLSQDHELQNWLYFLSVASLMKSWCTLYGLKKKLLAERSA